MKNRVVFMGKNYDDDGVLDCLISVNSFIGDSLASVSLPVDTLDVVLRDYVANGKNSTLDKVAQYGDTVLYERKDGLFGKFHLEEITRTGKNEYKLRCVSAVGLLLTSNHYGGIYSGEPSSEVIADVIGGIVDFTIDPDLQNVPVYGWLPKATRRDNLRDVLFAIGGQIRKDAFGEINIVPLKESEPYEISADNFYLGGSVTGTNPATTVNVTEHSYSMLDANPTVTLFDGESADYEMVTPKGNTVSGVLVDFSQPVYNLQIQNAEILESGANYAVISGSPNALLVGKEYAHTERIITRNRNSGGAPNVITSSKCTLVNLLNSELIADRLFAYYGSAKTVGADIIATTQKPGDMVRFTDPFGEETTGFISDMDITMSAIMKAKATIIAGFTPTESGNYYSHFAVLIEDGVFVVPPECKGKIRVVLIGGGDGGSCGEAGTDGTVGDEVDNGYSYGSGGSGGKAGTGGKSGKVFVFTASVNVGDMFDVHIGTGGSGGVFGGGSTQGGVGGDTTFGPITSANGYNTDKGYVGLINRQLYSLPGENGVDGGNGDAGGAGVAGSNVTYDGQTWIPGKKGKDDVYDADNGAGGGWGGGPAVGYNGENGADGVYKTTGATAGKGGNGATPIKGKTPVEPGSGGHGGHGGGGGGGAAAVFNTRGSEKKPVAGKGGNGGDGGDGANGVVLVYY